MYTGFLHLHSFLRYIVVILLIYAIVKSLMGWLYKKPFTKLDGKVGLFLMISCHVQLLIGLALYGISPLIRSYLKDFAGSMHNEVERFWVMEHGVGMIIAIALVTIGRIVSKKKTDDNAKHRISFIYYFIAFLIIFFLIPWPWKEMLHRPWF